MLFKGTLIASAMLGASVLALGLGTGNALERSGLSAVSSGELQYAKSPISLGNAITAPALAALAGLGWEAPNTLLIGEDAMPTVYELTFALKKGDTLGRLLARAGIDADQANAAVGALAKIHNPSRIKAGGRVMVRYLHAIPDEKGIGKDSFYGFALPLDPRNRVEVSLMNDGGFDARATALQLESEATRAEGDISSSLYLAAAKAGVSAPVIGELIRIFSWDVDFQRDIRKGDRFEVMYQRHRDENGKVAYSDGITFAALTLSGQRKAMFAMKQSNGSIEYFDASGQSAKKALMRTPIDGARLSSSFGKRKHPILGYTKMHKGADFAAPRGTPIYAAGSGTVEHAGRNGAYGNYVRIRHNSEYSTAYAHMKAVNTKRGRRVKQGQVIGFVGTTGRSTGPHLHYEILKNKKQVNPMKIKMPSGRKLKGNEMAMFKSQRQQIEQRWAALKTESQQLAAR